MATVATTPTPENKKEKKTRHRSPNYPAESLENAVKRVKKLYDADHEAGSSVDSAAVHIGFNKPHGEAKSVLAGLKKFGLVDMAGKRVTVTKRAVSILMFPEAERGKKALQDAALLPDIYRKLVNRYKATGLPSDVTVRAELIADEGFNPRSVDTFIKDFRASLKYAGISLQGGVNLSKEASEEHLEEEEPNLNASEETLEKPKDETPPSGKPSKSKVFNVALDPITRESPLFAQVLIPIPISEEQKKRLISFIENL